ncbi:LLM class flavin-dependent oxidoreductase [Streptomyces sp. NBC_01262]|uniref:LLM class flavin-dependent oxidoreductase n=1 Tax=Streptomyces sp. NBC_01262 TaxID=2903803 RepID=UPI002E2FCC77|nr:LLM class flavin-dependent oxidoreductase [Streptomyces sp. NBC_01262]
MTTVTVTAERVGPLWGAHVPQIRSDVATMTALAVAADEAGVDNFWLMDHLIGPGAPRLDVLEGWTLLSALATATSRVRLGLLVGCNPFRHPAVLAKMAATVDQISGGRLDLGIGWGSYEPELSAFGFDGKSRKQRSEELDESLDIVRLMFAGEPFDYDGRHFRLRDAIGRPTPVQRRLPVHIGGGGRQLTMPLVARHADWWNCVASARERLAELAPLRGAARISAQYAVGLLGASADREAVTTWMAVHLPEAGWGTPLIGTPDELVELLRAEREKGIEMFVLRFHDYRDPGVFRRFMTEVAAHVK